MECRHGNFWIGLGIGSILGAVAYLLLMLKEKQWILDLKQ